MIWQGQVTKNYSPKNEVVVSFAGEMGIDSGALRKTISLPVAHMKESENFKNVFFLGYCNGQATVRR